MVMSDRIALLHAGELEQVAPPQEIYRRPATAYAAQFIGHTNLLVAEVREGTARCASLAWKTHVPDGKVLFSLRPECIRLSGNPLQSVQLRARVIDQSFHGASELVRVQTSGGLILTVRSSDLGALRGEIDLLFSGDDAVPVRGEAGPTPT